VAQTIGIDTKDCRGSGRLGGMPGCRTWRAFTRANRIYTLADLAACSMMISAKTGIGADGWRIEQGATVDVVRVAPKNLAPA